MSERTKKGLDIKIVMITILFLAIDIFLILRLLENQSETVEIIIIAAILAIVNVSLFLIYFRKFRKKKGQQKEQTPDSSLELEDLSENEEFVLENYGPLKDGYKETALDLARPRLNKASEIVYKDKLDFSKYCDKLSKYLISNGLSVEKNAIRELFSSINASKIIVINTEYETVAQRFMEVVSDFIGSKFYVDAVRDDLRVFNDLYRDRYKFKDLVKSGIENPDLIHFMLYKNVELSNLENYFEKLMNYSLDPRIPTVIDNSYYNKPLTMPNNLWFMLVKKANQEEFNSSLLAKSSVQFDLNVKLVEPVAELDQNNKLLSYTNFSNMSKKGYEEYYLSEDNWKKLDKIEEFVKQYTKKLLDNKQFRQFERYTSTFIMFGGDELIAIDRAIVAKLIRLVYLVNFKKKLDVSENIFDVFQSSLGLENLEKSKDLLIELQEKAKA